MLYWSNFHKTWMVTGRIYCQRSGSAVQVVTKLIAYWFPSICCLSNRQAFYFYLFILVGFCKSFIPSAFASSILLKRDFCGSASDWDLALVPFTICVAKRWTLSSGHATSGPSPRLSELQIRAVAHSARESMSFFLFFLQPCPASLLI